ncbi:MAG TPA: chromosomal replication initiator protein DnaA [Tissierellia bacterium]|nr:chromosomal replication initiator protein DnaA [Tissierellia bacterium]
MKDELRQQHDELSFNTWIADLDVYNEDDRSIFLLAPSKFVRSILEKRKYPQEFTQLYQRLTGQPKSFVLVSLEDVEREQFDASGQVNKSNLNPKYVFEDFVVGSNNQFAHAACVAVAEDPSKSYNPLFIYGGVGLGKTHLMQAVGHYISKKQPDSRILYISSENFTNDFINSIKNTQGESFRERYRNVDVLLIDDIQFLADKEQTQEEFFHTFNELYLNNKQIVISSDRPPKEIKTLEERLRSRFEMGLITDISSPDYETRIAILRKKAEVDRKTIPDDVFDLIAKNIKSNIRELEGSLNKVTAYSSLVGKVIDVELTKEALKEVIDRNIPKTIDQHFIRELICNYFDVTEKELDSPKRTKRIAYPRQVAMYLIREYTDLSLPKIGEIFGNRDHSTVVHACDKLTGEVENNPETKEMIDQLKERMIG